MADATAHAAIKITADTSQAVRDIGKLTAAQKGFSQEVIASQTAYQKFSAFADKAADGLSKFNLAIGGLQKGFGIFKAGLDMAKEVNELHKLEKAVPTSTFNALDDATGHLLGRVELLSFGARALSSDFKLTETQMGDVLEAAQVLKDRGMGDLASNSEKLLKAVQKGGEGLDDFGLKIKKTGDATRDSAEVLKKLHEIAGQGAEIDAETQRIASLSRSLEDFAIVIKETVGVAIQGLTGLGEFIGEQAASMLLWYSPGGGRMPTGLASDADNKQWWKDRAAREAADRQRRANSPGSSLLKGGLDTFGRVVGYGTARDAGAAFDSAALDDLEKRQNKGIVAVYVTNAREVGEHVVNPMMSVGAGDFGGAAWNSNALSELERNPYGLSSQVDAISAGVRKSGWAAISAQGGGGFRGSDELAGQGDRLRDLKQQLGDTNTVTGAAFSTIQSGIAAAVDAAITGSDSIGRAAAKASAAVLKSLAIESTGRAVYEGALAIGSLAIGDPKGAGLHALAAAKYAAAAVITGGLASGLGSLAGGAGSGASASGSGPAAGGFAHNATGGSAGGGSITNINLNFGDGIVGEEAITQAVARGLREANRRGERTTYTTRFGG